ncbi:MAG: hypothetical protein ACOZCO_01655 [Bacteroidota bacterium]
MLKRLKIFFGILILFHSGCSVTNENETSNYATTDTSKTKPGVSDTVSSLKPEPPPAFFLENCRLTISDEIKNLIEKEYPEFRCWKMNEFSEDCPDFKKEYKCTGNSSPFAVTGDFNGDKIKDAVLSGTCITMDVIFCMISDKDTHYNFQVITATRKSYFSDKPSVSKPWIYLKHQPPGKIKSHWEEDTLILNKDGFHVIYCGKASTLYYWKNNQLNEFAISD